MYRRTPSNHTHSYHSSRVVTLTGHVALVVREDPEDELDDRLLRALEQRLLPHGLALQLQHLPPDGLDRNLDLAEWRSSWGLEGLLVHHQRAVPNETLQRMRSALVPCVWCGHNATHDCVYFDEHSAAVEAVRLLVQHGHREIAFASFREPEIFSQGQHAWRDRQAGYRHAMVEAGLRVRVVIGAAAIGDALIGDDAPSAVITPCRNDAAGTIHLLGSNGRHIPRDCSLVTFAPHAVTIPGLAVSTLVAPSEFMGATAIDLLMRQFQLREPVPSVGIGYDAPSGETIATA